MTFEQLLGTLPSSPLEVGSPMLEWWRDVVPSEEYAREDLRRYGVVSGLDENDRRVMHDASRVVDQLVVVKLFEKPLRGVTNGKPVTTTPPDAHLYALYESVLSGARDVTSAGKRRSFVSFEPASNQQPPRRDPDTNGLAATLNFRLKFYRK